MILTLTSVKVPKWLRIAVVASVIVMAAGAALFSYRWYFRPTTLTVTVGSLDGEAARIVSAIAGRLTAANATVRLRVVEVPSALQAAKAFSSGTTDLAVVRSDAGDLSQAQAVAVVAHPVAMLIAPPGSSITAVTDVKRGTIGVIGGEINQGIVGVLTDEYDLGRNVKFRDLNPTEARRALETKEVQAILVVVPLVEKYLTLLRGLFHQNAKSAPTLVAIESAGAIAEKNHAYESFDVPKGTLRGSPPVPNEDLTTLRVTLYLVAKKQLDANVITAFTQALMNARRDLLSELPIVGQVAAAETEPDAFLPAHPGAAAFYNGTQLSFLDQWGNAIFLAPMILGGLISVLAAGWKFLRTDGEPATGEQALDQLYALGRRIRATEKQTELSDIEGEIDAVLQAQRAKSMMGDENALDVTTLNVAAHRLEYLIHDRRTMLAVRPGGSA